MRGGPRYSTTFGTRKNPSSDNGALARMSGSISPSVTMSSRIGNFIGMTEVMGSTPSTSTASSSATKARMALISPCRCGTSASLDGDARQMRDAADGWHDRRT